MHKENRRRFGVRATLTTAALVLAAGSLTTWAMGGPPGGTITGTVTEAGVPFEGATVTASIATGAVGQTTTNKNGSYTLNLPAGSYSLSADFDDGTTSCNGGTQLDVRVKNNKTVTQDIAITCVSFP